MSYTNIDLEKHTYIYLVNTDVPMSAGKVAAQVSNVSCQLPRLPKGKNKLMDNVSRTYIFAASEEEMMFFLKFFGKELDIKWTVDSGNTTEYTYGVLTCIGWKRPCIEYKALTNHLYLYGKHKKINKIGLIQIIKSILNHIKNKLYQIINSFKY